VTLRQAIARLDEWDEDATLYVAGEPSEWSSDSEVAVGVEDVEAEIETLPVEAEGKRYFLEISVAREVLAGEQRNLDRELTLDERVARVIHYARFDA
jgi:hypothetical protein